MGFWEYFLGGIFEVINWFHSWCGDWGLSIVLITILFRLLIYPITRKQFKSSHEMQKLQPRIKEINERYKDDPQRKQQETMKLYQEAKFNPLAGCLPMLLQMPIFIALYQVLGNIRSYIGGDQPISFFGILPDLTSSPGTIFGVDPAAVLPYAVMLLLFAVSMLIPMLIQKSGDNNTRIMMIVMSAFMLWIGWGAPAGVLLYWDVSSYLGVAQQYITKKLLERKDAQHELETIDVTPVKVTVDRAERKARPKKKK